MLLMIGVDLKTSRPEQSTAVSDEATIVTVSYAAHDVKSHMIRCSRRSHFN